VRITRADNTYNTGGFLVETSALRDALLQAAKGNAKKHCKIGSIIKSLEKETSDALIVAMASDATTMSIARALAANNLPVGRDVVGTKRECFRNPDSPCCIRGTIDNCLGENS